MFTYKGHQDSITAISVSSNRTFIATISQDKTIRIWSLINGACLDVITDKSSSLFKSITFSPNGDLLAATTEKGRVFIWSMEGFDSTKSTGLSPNHVKTVNLRFPVKHCCFSPGENLIAVALEHGVLAVFSVYNNCLWTTNICDGSCDYCSFHPTISTLIFTYSSKSGVASMWEITDKLRMLQEFNGRQIFKRYGQCLFSLSCDSSLVFCCSSTTLVTWAQSDGSLLSKIENLTNIVTICPHVFINEIVALVTKQSVIFVNCEIGKIINTQMIPCEGSKLSSGCWDSNGIKFYAGDNGGFYTFRLQNESQIQTPSICKVSEYFFPSDFTPSEWEDPKGQVEEKTHTLVHLNPRDQIVNSHLELLITDYHPYEFTDIFLPNSLHSQSKKSVLYEIQWLSKYASKTDEIITAEDEEENSIKEKKLNKILTEEAEAIFSDEEDEVSSENEESKPMNHYPFWTTLISTNRGTYFPQCQDKVIYIREGHIDMLKNDSSLFQNITPDFTNELYWPEISIFQIININYSKYYCEIQMLKLNLKNQNSLPPNTNIFLEELNNIDSLEINQNEPIRTFNYALSDAPYFLIEALHFKSASNVYNKLKVNDEIVAYYRHNGIETAYTGKVLLKLNKTNLFNSVEIDWGEEVTEFLSPWEFYSVNDEIVFKYPLPTPELKIKFDAIYKVIEAAQRNRTLRTFFKQPKFSNYIVYPSDLGLIKRRIENNFYRNIDGLKFDILQVIETQKIIDDENNVISIQILVDKLLYVLNHPNDYKQFLDFSKFDDEVEEKKNLLLHEKEIKKREQEKAQKNALNKIRNSDYVNYDEIESSESKSDDDEFKNDLSDDDEEFVNLSENVNSGKKKRNYYKSDDFVVRDKVKANYSDDSDFRPTDDDTEDDDDEVELEDDESSGGRSRRTRKWESSDEFEYD
ncbi:AT hook motif family protein [Histomonas meleagridis]|uniref:AT hook motif family protein n=1 Tax=Histomonas meleagridis TaxID=135588 RepID=UPI0035598170|nr:AT hook motif family protein [Histomonas meleagridis]KAH0805834.1 AT hook motif family protein [Histomonas meleagridis]